MALPDEDQQQLQGYRFTNGKLKADFEIIRTLANNRGAVWTEKATGSRSKVVGTTLDASSFSGIDSCKQFGSVYTTAKQIYEETLKGVEEDVKAYQDKLLQVATHLEDKDNRAGEVFAALAAPAAQDSLQSNVRNTQANEGQDAVEAEHAQEQAAQQVEQAGQQGHGPDGGPGGNGDHGGGAGPDGGHPGADNAVGGTAPAGSGTDNLVTPGAAPATDEGDTTVQASR